MKKLQYLLAIPLIILSSCGGNSNKSTKNDGVTIPGKNNVATSKKTINTEGRDLFNNNCAACHKIDSKLIGPALKGIEDRHKEEWIVKFVKNSTEMIEAGDTAAVAIYEEYNKVQMTAFTSLSDEQIKQILAYIKEKS